MFYDYTLEVIERDKGYVNDDGLWVEGGEVAVEQSVCDIQPIGKELAFKEYGYEGNVKYRVYSPKLSKAILRGQIILNKGKTYRIEFIQEWEDYMIMLVSDINDS